MAPPVVYAPPLQLHLPQVKSKEELRKAATSKLTTTGEQSGDEAEADDKPIKLILAHLPKKENLEQRRLLVHHALETEEQDNKRLMTKIRQRMERWVKLCATGAGQVPSERAVHAKRMLLHAPTVLNLLQL